MPDIRDIFSLFSPDFRPKYKHSDELEAVRARLLQKSEEATESLKAFKELDDLAKSVDVLAEHAKKPPSMAAIHGLPQHVIEMVLADGFANTVERYKSALAEKSREILEANK